MPKAPQFTKRDYEMVAKTIRELYDLFDNNAVAIAVLHVIVARFAQAFHEDNQRFDMERFLDACKRPLH